MISTEFQLVDLSPGSVSCIVIGRVPKTASFPAATCRAVLWIVDEARAAKPPANFPAGLVTTVVIERSNAGQIEEAVHAFIVKFPKTLPSLFVSRTFPVALQPRFAIAIDCVLGDLAYHSAARRTRQLDAFTWQRYFFQNLPRYLARQMPEEWEGKLTGLPAFVCGAGPSFDASALRLAPVARQGVVFAGDSSLRLLARLGVQADFAVSIDAAKEPAKCLPETHLPRRLILTAVSSPRWSEVLPAEQQFFLSGNQLTLDWLEGQGVPRTKVAVAENCGVTALELARFMGCAPIYLFGMDLALKPADAAYRNHEAVDATVYENLDTDARRRLPLVPGNFEDKVPTHVFTDLRELERRIASWPPGLVSVVTNGGARIKNTAVLLPEQFNPIFTNANKQERLVRLSGSTSLSRDLIRSVAESIDRTGTHFAQWPSRARVALEASQIDALAGEFRNIFSAPEDNRLFGAYLMKLAPHILPPVTGDANFWRAAIEELETLANLAEKSAASLRKDLI